MKLLKYIKDVIYSLQILTASVVLW